MTNTETLQEPVVSDDISIEDFSKFLQTGELASPRVDAPEKTTEPEAESEPDPKQEAEPEAEAQDGQTEDDSIVMPDDPKGVKQRIGKVLEQRRIEKERADRLQQELDALKANRDWAPQNESPAEVQTDKPRLDQFDSVEDFTEALTDWKLNQREIQQKNAQHTQSINDKIKAATEKYPDFEAVAFSPEAVRAIKQLPILGTAITESPIFADLAMHLGQNPAELNRMASLSPARALVELGIIETALKAPKQAAPKQKTLPAPPVLIPAGKSSQEPTTLNGDEDLEVIRRVLTGK